MNNITTGQDENTSFKKSVCISISLAILRFYEHFRNCSGVKEGTKRKLKQYSSNENKVKIVEEKMPIIKKEADRLMDRNRYLEDRVVFMFNELKEIKEFAENRNCKSIIVLLSKYDFNKKLEY